MGEGVWRGGEEGSAGPERNRRVSRNKRKKTGKSKNTKKVQKRKKNKLSQSEIGDFSGTSRHTDPLSSPNHKPLDQSGPVRRVRRYLSACHREPILIDQSRERRAARGAEHGQFGSAQSQNIQKIEACTATGVRDRAGLRPRTEARDREPVGLAEGVDEDERARERATRCRSHGQSETCTEEGQNNQVDIESEIGAQVETARAERRRRVEPVDAHPESVPKQAQAAGQDPQEAQEIQEQVAPRRGRPEA